MLHFSTFKVFEYRHQSFFGSVVIDPELGREDHGSISHNCIRRKLKPLDIRTDLQTKLTSKNKK
jgi:hypothetical protein